MAEGLEYLHKNGIVHLNLSPGNVIVNQAQTSLKLREYGFRTFKMANFQAAPTHGNPRYVACEVMMRQHDNITTASDVWSWAFVMYWVVTGSEAFKAYKVTVCWGSFFVHALFTQKHRRRYSPRRSPARFGRLATVPTSRT